VIVARGRFLSPTFFVMPHVTRKLITGLAATALVLVVMPASSAQASGARCPAGFEISDHRGDYGPGPEQADENTLPAIRASARRGDAVELDVSSLKDGTEILFHDARWNRATDAAGRVARTRWRQARSILVQPHGTPLARLTEALQLTRRLGVTPVYLDIKGGTSEHITHVANILHRTHTARRVLITSWTRKTGEVAPGLRRMYKPDGPAPSLAEVRTLHVQAVGLHVGQMNHKPTLVSRLRHRLGVKVTSRIASTTEEWADVMRYPVQGMLTSRGAALARWCAGE